MHHTYKLIIAGEEYGMEEMEAESLMISRELFSDFSIGNAPAASMSVRILPRSVIPRCAEVQVFCDELPLGTFFIDTRRREDGWLQLNCYDAMLKGEVEYVTESADEWPKPMDDVLRHIAATMGVSLTAGTIDVIRDYDVPDPVGHTMREVLGWIGICHGGNFVITRENKLKFVPLSPRYSSEISESGLWEGIIHDKLIDEGEEIVVTGFRLIHSDADTEAGEIEEYFSGSEDGYVLEAECPVALKVICDDVMRRLEGKVFRPYSINTAVIEPGMEPGDRFTLVSGEETVGELSEARYDLMRWIGKLSPEEVGDIPVYILAHYHMVGGACLYGDIGMSGDEELNHEYPYLTPLEREVDALEKKVKKSTKEVSKSLAGFESRLTEEEMMTRIFAEWKTSSTASLAEVKTVASDAYAMAGMVVRVNNDGYEVDAEMVVEAINNSTVARIRADNIIMNGAVKFVTPDDLSGQTSTTVIYGGLIQTDTIDVQAIRRSTINGSALVDFGTGINATHIEVQSLVVGGKEVATQEWVSDQTANGGMIDLSQYATKDFVYDTVVNLGGGSSNGTTGQYAPLNHGHMGAITINGNTYTVYVS